MARRQGGKLEPPVGKEDVGTDQERADSVLDKRHECSLDIAAVACVNDVELHPEGDSRRCHVFRHGFDIRMGWVDQQSDARGCGNKLVKQP